MCPDNGECPDGNTCCKKSSGDYGCCPQANGVCCSDGSHCCPAGYTCNLQDGTCAKKGPGDEASAKNVICPGQKVECDADTTCCLGSTGDIVCCPGLNAVCCDDYIHCCPEGYICNADTAYCTKGDFASPFLEKTLALKPQVRDHKTGYEIPVYKKYPLVNASALKTPYN